MKKNKNKSFSTGLIIGLMLVPQVIYTIPAYMPAALRECMVYAQNIAKGKSNWYFEELCAMILEIRIFASDRLVRKAAEEALSFLDKDNRHADYVTQYLASLNQKSLLPALHGNEAVAVAMPVELIARSFKNNSADMDMIYLASQLATRENLEICGFADTALQKSETADTLRGTLSFSADSLTSAVAPVPNILIGTGVASAVMRGWAMSSSDDVQSPISMQFAIPADFNRDITIGLHFVVPKQGFLPGKIKIHMNGAFLRNNERFSIDEIDFSGSSHSVIVNEPACDSEFRHVYVKMSGRVSNFKEDSLAHFSFIRIEPIDMEYMGDIILVAANVIY
jgi:hypothetical protein